MSLYRGAGGASDATDDSTVNAVAGYASAAASSASAAATSATEASNSANASASSASSAATSASSVATNATNAASSASLASTYAAAANNSKEDAAASAATASTKAGEASTSSSNAATSASTATTQATNAANSATAAAGSATSAATSAANALAIYGNTAAMNAAVTSAATSASTAAFYADAANEVLSYVNASRDEAAAAATSSSGWATTSQASANSAQAYATAALSARDATLAAYDNFDDRYLGVKSADPTVDNDGNPLIAGSLYFNDQTNMMMLRAGNAWVAAYTSGGSPSFGNTVVNGTLGVTGAVTLSGGTANGVAYLNGSKILTTGTALTFDGTNLGIGTSSPSAILDVRGNSGSDIGLIVKNDGAGRAVIKIDAGGTSQSNVNFFQAGVEKWRLIASGGTSFGLYDITASAYRWYVDSSGNLGIGVTPSSWATIKALQVSNASIYGNGGSDAAFSQNAYYNAGWKYISSAAAAQFMFDNGAHKWFTAASGTAGTAITWTQAMTLNSSGNLLVGTTSSGARVTVADTNNAISAGVTNGAFLLREVGGSSANNTLELNVRPNSGKSGYLTFTESGVADRWSIGIAAGDSGLLFRSGIASTERMRLDSSGNLGIGTSSPLLRLDAGVPLSAGTVQDVAIFHQVSGADPTTGQGARIYLAANSSTGRAAAIQALVTDGLNGHSLQFLTQQAGNVPAVRATIDASGNLGIGTSSPGAKLHVSNGTGQNTQIGSLTLDNFTGDGSGAAFSRDSDGALTSAVGTVLGDSLGVFSRNNIVFATGGASTYSATTERMRLDSNGNLGIGVTPSAWGAAVRALDIGTNQAALAGAGNNLYLTTNSYYNGTNWIYKTGAYAQMYQLSSGQHQWYIAPVGTAGNAITFTQAMTLDASGNLLVGLTSATGTAKLQVSGPLRTTGYTVSTLPTGTVGMRTYVTDALAPSFGATVVGGGAVTIPVFYNGTNWIVA